MGLPTEIPSDFSVAASQTSHRSFQLPQQLISPMQRNPKSRSLSGGPYINGCFFFGVFHFFFEDCELFIVIIIVVVVALQKKKIRKEEFVVRFLQYRSKTMKEWAGALVALLLLLLSASFPCAYCVEFEEWEGAIDWA